MEDVRPLFVCQISLRALAESECVVWVEKQKNPWDFNPRASGSSAGLALLPLLD